MRKELLKSALQSPAVVLTLSVAASVIGIYCLAQLTETLFLSTVFFTLMMPMIVSSVSGLAEEVKSYWHEHSQNASELMA